METIPHIDPDDTLELPVIPYDPAENDDIETEEAETACTWIGGHEAREVKADDGLGRETIEVECRFCGDPMPRWKLRDEYRRPVWVSGRRVAA